MATPKPKPKRYQRRWPAQGPATPQGTKPASCEKCGSLHIYEERIQGSNLYYFACYGCGGRYY